MTRPMSLRWRPTRAALILLLGFAASSYGQTPADRNPVLVQAVAPTYPRSRFKNPSRTVLVGLTVDPAGTPQNVHIVHSGGDRFDENAVATVAQYKFKPALKAGQPIAADIQVEVSYKTK